MHRDIPSILKTVFVGLIIITVIAYAYYRTRDIANGPILTITSPQNGTTIENELLLIKGTALNISHITLNDRQIFTDEDGNFEEELLLYPGYNIISIKVRDKLERKIEKTLELIYNGDEDIILNDRKSDASENLVEEIVTEEEFLKEESDAVSENSL